MRKRHTIEQLLPTSLPMNLTFLDRKTVGEVPNLSRLNDFGSLTLYDTTTPDQVQERLQDQQVVIINKVIMDREAIDSANALQLICVAATGMDNVDSAYAEEKGVAVKNVSGYSTPSVAQLTWTMILTLLQRPNHFNEFVYSGNYARHDIFTYFDPPFGELGSKRLGIIGLGTIGQRVAAIGRAFGAEVVYYSSSGKHDHADYPRLPLDELLSSSDIVSIHAPLTEHTKNLLTYPQLQQMPDHALLINTGRGGIVNEADLARAIDEGIIGGAGIDVFTEEPIPQDHPYLSVRHRDHLLLTPHLAWASVEARTRLMDGVYENIREFVASKEDNP